MTALAYHEAPLGQPQLSKLSSFLISCWHLPRCLLELLHRTRRSGSPSTPQSTRGCRTCYCRSHNDHLCGLGMVDMCTMSNALSHSPLGLVSRTTNARSVLTGRTRHQPWYGIYPIRSHKACYSDWERCCKVVSRLSSPVRSINGQDIL